MNYIKVVLKFKSHQRLKCWWSEKKRSNVPCLSSPLLFYLSYCLGWRRWHDSLQEVPHTLAPYVVQNCHALHLWLHFPLLPRRRLRFKTKRCPREGYPKTLSSVFRAGVQPVISVRRLFTSAKYRDNVEAQSLLNRRMMR